MRENAYRQFDLRRKMTNKRFASISYLHISRDSNPDKDHSVYELRLITFLKSLSKRLGKRACTRRRRISWERGKEEEKKKKRERERERKREGFFLDFV